jgi:hypothetical protein
MNKVQIWWPPLHSAAPWFPGSSAGAPPLLRDALVEDSLLRQRPSKSIEDGLFVGRHHQNGDAAGAQLRNRGGAGPG